jgi:heme-degrading monooxygenase HmoA
MRHALRAARHDVEKGRTFLREQVIPRVSQAPGFVSAHWVRVSEDTGTSMLVFESEEAAQAMAEQVRTNPPPTDAVTMNTIEVGEVVEHA